ncbi:MAG: ParM/StbA family protein [Anaerolineae bacterium]|nr:ParM/StbA family protein [Anaerolineae bacterium]
MMNIAILDALVGVGVPDTGLLSLGVLSRGRSLTRPLCVTVEGVTRIAGAGVETYCRPTERLDFDRLADGPEMRTLTYATLSQLCGPGAHTLALMLGLPVEVLADAERARRTLRTLRGWLVGEHTFTVDDQTLHLHVTALNVLAQPAGAFFAWGFDDAGQWRRAPDDLQTPVAICDIGFNTVDLFTVQAGQVVARFTGGDTAGMRRAAELLVQAVRRQWAVTLSLHQADALLRARQPTLSSAGQTYDLAPLVHQARETTAGAVTAFLESRWGNGRQFGYVLLTGGGAAALHTTLLRQFPHAVLLPDAVSANALGLARYARRVFKEAPVVVGLDPGFGSFKAVQLER